MAVTQVDGHRQLKFSGSLDLQTNQVHNVVDPSSAQDAATKNYVDTAIANDAVGEVSYSNFVFNEVPSGTINGTNVTFTLAHTPQAGTALHLNGLRQTPGATNDFTISGATITFNAAPIVGDEILADYLK